MSSKEFQEAYKYMTEEEKDLMGELYMSGENHDCHVWVRYCDVEKIVGKIILGRKERGNL